MLKTILFLSALALGLGGCEPGFAQSGSSNSQRVQGVPGNLGDPVKTTSYSADGLTSTAPASSTTYWGYAAATGGISNTTTAVTVKTAAGASVRNYVTSIQCSTDTLGEATELAIRDGAAGTVLWRVKLGTTALADNPVVFNTPLKGTANTLVEIVTLTASITGGVFCNLQGYTGS